MVLSTCTGLQFDTPDALAYNAAVWKRRACPFEPLLREHQGMIYLPAGKAQLSLPNCMGYISAQICGSGAP